MDAGRQQHQSHLFTLRVWLEDLGDGRAEWRGQLQHVLSGETHYFRQWETLVALLLAMLPSPGTDSAAVALNEHVDPSSHVPE